jgi:hypothetical protein
MGGGRLRWFLVALALSGCAGNDKRCRRLHNMDIGCVEHWPKHRAQWSGRQWRIWGRYFPTPAPSLYAGASHPTPVPTPAPTRVPTPSPTPPSPAPTPQPTAFPTPPSPAPTPLEVRPEVLQHRCKTRYTPQCVYFWSKDRNMWNAKQWAFFCQWQPNAKAEACRRTPAPTPRRAALSAWLTATRPRLAHSDEAEAVMAQLAKEHETPPPGLVPTLPSAAAVIEQIAVPVLRAPPPALGPAAAPAVAPAPAPALEPGFAPAGLSPLGVAAAPQYKLVHGVYLLVRASTIAPAPAPVPTPIPAINRAGPRLTPVGVQQVPYYRQAGPPVLPLSPQYRELEKEEEVGGVEITPPPTPYSGPHLWLCRQQHADDVASGCSTTEGRCDDEAFAAKCKRTCVCRSAASVAADAALEPVMKLERRVTPAPTPRPTPPTPEPHVLDTWQRRTPAPTPWWSAPPSPVPTQPDWGPVPTPPPSPPAVDVANDESARDDRSAPLGEVGDNEPPAHREQGWRRITMHGHNYWFNEESGVSQSSDDDNLSATGPKKGKRRLRG